MKLLPPFVALLSASTNWSTSVVYVPGILFLFAHLVQFFSFRWNFASCQFVLAELVELLGTSQMLEIS